MRIHHGLLALALASSAVPALHAQAQPTSGVRFGLGGGLLVPLGNFATGHKLGANVLGLVQVPISNSEFHGRFSGMYGMAPHEVGNGTTTLVGASADLLYHVGNPSAAVRPYLLGGLGLYNVSNGTSQARIAFGAGGGLLFGIGTMHAFVETRYMSIQTSGSSLNFLPITLGLMFRS